MPIIIASTLRTGAAAAAPRSRGTIRPNGARFSLEDADEAALETPIGVAFVCPTALLQIQEAPGRDRLTRARRLCAAAQICSIASMSCA